jgi:hypothetical protein
LEKKVEKENLPNRNPAVVYMRNNWNVVVGLPTRTACDSAGAARWQTSQLVGHTFLSDHKKPTGFV